MAQQQLDWLKDALGLAKRMKDTQQVMSVGLGRSKVKDDFEEAIQILAKARGQLPQLGIATGKVSEEEEARIKQVKEHLKHLRTANVRELRVLKRERKQIQSLIKNLYKEFKDISSIELEIGKLERKGTFGKGAKELHELKLAAEIDDILENIQDKLQDEKREELRDHEHLSILARLSRMTITLARYIEMGVRRLEYFGLSPDDQQELAQTVRDAHKKQLEIAARQEMLEKELDNHVNKIVILDSQAINIVQDLRRQLQAKGSEHLDREAFKALEHHRVDLDKELKIIKDRLEALEHYLFSQLTLFRQSYPALLKLEKSLK
jgi:hypothetical protein